MANKRILWADDEINLLKPLVIFLEGDGNEVVTVTNGLDCLEKIKEENFDLVILDEQMPGMTGLDVLKKVKDLKPWVNVMMMTKSDDPATMDKAYGNLTQDYLVKPVNLGQLRSSVKRIVDRESIEEKVKCEAFLSENGALSLQISQCRSFDEWSQLYGRIVYWELQLESLKEMGSVVSDAVLDLKREANISFCKFITKNYENWLSAKPGDSNVPLLSHRLLSDYVKPALRSGEKIGLIVIDNFRLDQWETLRPLLECEFKVSSRTYCSILPTATQYSRNAIFSGLLPLEIKKINPQMWVDDNDDEEALNAYEREMLADYFTRQRLPKQNSYYKVGSNTSGEEYIKKFGGYQKNDLNAIVYNFVDELSHLGTSTRPVRDLISTDAGYRKLTKQWFETGTLKDIIRLFITNGYKVVLTTDHGTIRVKEPVDITGPKEINSNLRYKVARSMQYDDREVFSVTHPEKIGLPSPSVSCSFVFAQNRDFFVYPNNRNEHVRKYSGSLQHGGISLEEMILPLVTISAK